MGNCQRVAFQTRTLKMCLGEDMPKPEEELRGFFVARMVDQGFPSTDERLSSGVAVIVVTV